MAIHKLNNNSLSNLTEFSGTAAIGDMKLIQETSISSGTSSVEFTLGDKKEYKFFFVNIHPATDGAEFEFNTSTDSGSNYNTTKTTTFFFAEHSESGTSGFAYQTSRDLAQSTGFQNLGVDLGNGNDESCCGYFHLFNPSSTTFVKHFKGRIQEYHQNNLSGDCHYAGYMNTTSALTNIKFQMSSGNIDDGKILMFGLD